MHVLRGLRRGLAVAAVGGLMVAGAGVVSSPGVAKAPQRTKVSGSVTYRWWPCWLSLTPSKFVPLAGATIHLQRDGGKYQASERLSAAGTFKASIGGSGPITAKVLLLGPRVGVIHTDRKVEFYSIDVGVLHPGRNQIELKDLSDAGAANIWTVVNRGAAVAEKLSPVNLPRVWVRWDLNRDPVLTGEDGGLGTRYQGGGGDIGVISVDGRGTRHDEWYTQALLHEYGHHVLSTIAHVRSGGKHYLEGVYPMSPALPWDEGFAQAFAAVVLDTPSLMDNACKPKINVDAIPASPLPENPRLAQYNEVATAGTIWKLAQHFGNGNAQAGFKQLLDALHKFHYAGHGPESLRQARDALITGGLERGSPSEHSAIDTIFADEKIGWGEDVQVVFDDQRDAGYDAYTKLHLVLTGPYGSCQVTGDDINPPAHNLTGSQDQWYGDIGAWGGLPYTWQDECLVSGGNTDPSEKQGIANSLLSLTFPYLTDEKHLSGNFSLTVQYLCSDHTEGMEPTDPNWPNYACTSDRKVDVIVMPTVGDPIAENGIDLQRGAPTTIQDFNATGNVCVLYPNHDDCRT